MKNNTQLSRLLRKKSTPTELLLWKRLRSRQFYGYKFRRQHPIGPYIVDFYCSTKKIVIEIDGDVHALKPQIQHDKKREQYLQDHGLHVVRFTNLEIKNNLNGVGECLLKLFSPSQYPSSYPSPSRGEGTSK